jgi:acetyl-CoA carboxylase biotin carboxyl carrier protein
MNLKELREMIQLMDEHQLVELELEREGTKIRLKKSSGREAEPVVEIRQVPASASLPLASAPAAAPPPSAAFNAKRVEVKTPMVGTFYRAPAPEAPPFVEKGAAIDVGQVLCIIEAMKLMNELKSEIKGTIVEIRAENGQPVEFGQVLFVVEVA